MPRYSVSYTREDKTIGNCEIVGNDETQARIKFLNRSEVAFTPVTDIKITEIAEDRTTAARVERVTKRKVGQLPEKGWRDDLAALSAKIAAKSDERQRVIKFAKTDEDWSRIDDMQEELRKMSITREQLVRKNGPGAAKS